MQVSNVPPETAPAVWQELRPMIERALARGQGDGTSWEHMLVAILMQKMSLWVIHEGEDIVACVVLSVSDYPKGKKVHIQLTAGKDLDRWIEQIEGLLRDYRDLVGAIAIEASCRKGLARRLSRRGWGRKAVIMELQ